LPAIGLNKPKETKVNKVTVKSGPFRVYPGTFIGLNAAQAQPRAHSLRATGDQDVYEVLSIVEFKRGESLSIKTRGLSRAEMDRLDDLNDAPTGAPLRMKKPAKVMA
jgi:hypothetical protein